MNILVVEDELALSKSICDYLTESQYTCETASVFDDAIQKMERGSYDCIILDITLPGGSGLELLEQLKSRSVSDGVLIISAKGSVDDKILGLKTGADDYLAKPFHLAELTARVEAIIRRKAFDGQRAISFGKLKIDIADKRVYLDGQLVDLTRKEFDLLIFLVSNKNKLVTKSAIAHHLWGDDANMNVYGEMLYTHVKNLRKKIYLKGEDNFIESIYGIGYRFLVSSGS